MPDCTATLPLAVYLLGAGTGLIAATPTVLLAWLAGRRAWLRDRTAQVQRAARPGDLALALAHYADGKQYASVNERLRLWRFRKRLRATSKEGQRR